MSAIPVITVDGPSGVGKGTISQLLTRDLSWHFLDSGALYRLLGLSARRHGIDFADHPALAAAAAHLDVQFLPDDTGGLRVVMEKQDVTDAIRTESAGGDASRVAAVAPVREALLQRQRDFCSAPGLVADGRDMGTTVFPGAVVKIFLTASAEIRAERRYKQLKEKGLDVNLENLLVEIAERDARDTHRATSPLRPASDAIVVDTSDLDIAQVYAKVRAACAAFFD